MDLLKKPSCPWRTDGAIAQQRALSSVTEMEDADTCPAQSRAVCKDCFRWCGGVGGNVAHLAAMADMAAELAMIDITRAWQLRLRLT